MKEQLKEILLTSTLDHLTTLLNDNYHGADNDSDIHQISTALEIPDEVMNEALLQGCMPDEWLSFERYEKLVF